MQRCCLFVFAVLALLLHDSGDPTGSRVRSLENHDTSALATRARISKLPLRFEANAGQWDANVRFVARGNGTTVFLTDEGATLELRDVKMPPRPPGTRREEVRAAREKALAEVTTAAITLKLVGATSIAPHGEEEIVTKSNFLLGNDPTQWRTNVPNFAQVRAKDSLPGVDIVWHGGPGGLEYDVVVAAGVDASTLAFDIGGADSVRVGDGGDLQIATAAGTLVQKAPRVVQGHRELQARYRAYGGTRVGFDIAGYDTSRSLLIDPVLSYSTYLGGGGSDFGQDIAVDSTGNAYVTGSTASTSFPTASAYQATFGGVSNAFVTKLNAAGSALVYSTYLGGTGWDQGLGIAVDASGNAYVTGVTSSSDFPTQSPLQSAKSLGVDAFVSKLNADGSGLVYSTYLGGSDDDYAVGIAVDGSSNASVTGATLSTDFPMQSPLQGTNSAASSWATVFDAFVSKLNADGSALVYSTYLGGTQQSWGCGIAVDASGNAYVTGSTGATDFPTKNALQGSNAGGDDVYISELTSTGSDFVYSTYLGGTNRDEACRLTVDGSGNAYATGWTTSIDFPTQNALQSSNAGGADAFISELTSGGSALVYSTYFGGTGNDYPNDIAVDGSGNAYVTGFTDSTDFPTVSALQGSNAGKFDAFLTKLASTGSTVVYSTYLGGAGADRGYGVAVDGSGNAYVSGVTESTDFPTQSAFQGSYAGSGDAFVAEIANTSPLKLAPSSASGIAAHGIPSPTAESAGWGCTVIAGPMSGHGRLAMLLAVALLSLRRRRRTENDNVGIRMRDPR